MSKVELEKAKDTIAKAMNLSDAVQELVAVYANGVADGYRLQEERKNGETLQAETF